MRQSHAQPVFFSDAGVAPSESLISNSSLFDAGRPIDGLFVYPTEVTRDTATIRLAGSNLAAVNSVRVRKKGSNEAWHIAKRPRGMLLTRGVINLHLGSEGEFALPEPLAPNTRYAFEVETSLGVAEGSFLTTPPAETDVRFLVYGDNRTDAVSHRSVVEAMLKRPRDLLLHTGDYVEVGPRNQDWTVFFALERELLANRYLVGAVGNHELIDPVGANYIKYLAPEGSDPTSLHVERRGFVRAVRWGRAHIFLLAGMDDGGESDERIWLEKELDRSIEDSPGAFRIVALHHSPWSSGPHGNNRKLAAAGVVDLLVKKRVDVIFAGHDHIYERGSARGIAYVVTGGGGAPLYAVKKRIPEAERVESTHHFLDVEITDGKLTYEAVRDDLSTIETCVLEKGKGAFSCDGAPARIPEPEPTKITPVAKEPAKSGYDPVFLVFGGIFALGLGMTFASRRRRKKRRKKDLPEKRETDKNPRP